MAAVAASATAVAASDRIKTWSLSEEAKKLRGDLTVRLTQTLASQGLSSLVNLIVAYASTPYVERPRFWARGLEQNDPSLKRHALQTHFLHRNRENQTVVVGWHQVLSARYPRDSLLNLVSLTNLESGAAEVRERRALVGGEVYTTDLGYDGGKWFVFANAVLLESGIDESLEVRERNAKSPKMLDYVDSQSLVKGAWNKTAGVTFKAPSISYDHHAQTFLILSKNSRTLFLYDPAGSHQLVRISLDESYIPCLAGVDRNTIVVMETKQLSLITHFREEPRRVFGPKVDRDEEWESGAVDLNHRSLFLVSTYKKKYGGATEQSVKMFTLPGMELQRQFLLSPPYVHREIRANDTTLVVSTRGQKLSFWDIANGVLLSTITFKTEYQSFHLTDSQLIGHEFQSGDYQNSFHVYDFCEGGEK